MMRFSTRPAKPIRAKNLTGGLNRRRIYGATRVFTIANAGPTGQWINRVNGGTWVPSRGSRCENLCVPDTICSHRRPLA